MIDAHSLELFTDDDWETFAKNVLQYKHFFENQFQMFSRAGILRSGKAVHIEKLLDGKCLILNEDCVILK